MFLFIESSQSKYLSEDVVHESTLVTSNHDSTNEEIERDLYRASTRSESVSR